LQISDSLESSETLVVLNAKHFGPKSPKTVYIHKYEVQTQRENCTWPYISVACFLWTSENDFTTSQFHAAQGPER